jgi:hypothetical protein
MNSSIYQLKTGFAAGMNGRQGTLTPPRHLMLPLIYLADHVFPNSLKRFSQWNYEMDWFSLSWPIHICLFLSKTARQIVVKKESTVLLSCTDEIICPVRMTRYLNLANLGDQSNQYLFRFISHPKVFSFTSITKRIVLI